MNTAELLQILEGSLDVVLAFGLDGRLRYVSPSAKETAGFSPEEMLGTDAFSYLHEEDKPKASAMVELAVASPGRRVCERIRVRRADGSWAVADSYGRFIPGVGGGLIVINSRDVTRRIESEALNDRLLAALEQSPAVVVFTDLQGRIEYVNRRFEELSGYSHDEAVGRNPRFLKGGGTSPEAYRELWLTILSGGTWTGEFQNRSKSGRLYTVRAAISPLRGPDGEIERFLAIEEDITEAKRLEAQLHQAQKMESVGRLAGGVAHDFNNLLTAIMGFADLAAQGLPEDSPVRHDLREIRDTGRRAAQLTAQLLAFSRRQVVEPKLVDLGEVLGGMQKMLARIIGEDIELSVQIAEGPGPVWMDPTQIEQLVMNLAVNARDAMPGGGKLALSTGRAVLDQAFVRENPGSAPGEYALLTVTDTGMGMSEEVKSRIFEPFFTTKGQGKGTGLGLATCYGVVKQNRGYIAVDSEPGRGTTFRVYLPLSARAPAASEGGEESAPRGKGGEALLVVEDDPAVRGIATRMLRQLGYRPVSASGAREALELLRRDLKGRIRLVLTDMVMPRGSGVELAAEARGLRPSIRILFTTGYFDEAIGRRAPEDERFPLLRKPYTIVELSKRVREALDA